MKLQQIFKVLQKSKKADATKDKDLITFTDILSVIKMGNQNYN